MILSTFLKEILMQLKLSQLITMRNSLTKLVEKDLPIKQSYNLARFIKKANEELTSFEEARIKLVNKYGEKDETGNLSVTEKNQQQFLNELEELTDIEIEFDNFRALKLADLRNVTLSTQDMMGLIDIVEE